MTKHQAVAAIVAILSDWEKTVRGEWGEIDEVWMEQYYAALDGVAFLLQATS